MSRPSLAHLLQLHAPAGPRLRGHPPNLRSWSELSWCKKMICRPHYRHSPTLPLPSRPCARCAAQALLREGLCMVDDGAPDKVRLFWFPCMSGMQG